MAIHNVTFTYDGESAALDRLELEIPAGANVALVGPSGAGKSTVFNLILRFFDPEAGRLTIDGQDLREVTLASLRARIALVSQDSLLFDDTVRANILYGRSDASEEELENAAIGAHAQSFIRELPQGYDTPVGPRGVRLSGGQRQRVLIARAILRNAPVLLLDEATSSLDNESERIVQDALQQLKRGRTTIVIAHRLSTVVSADCIYVMDKGRVVERGRHLELIARDGIYARLYAQQFASEADQTPAREADQTPSAKRIRRQAERRFDRSRLSCRERPRGTPAAPACGAARGGRQGRTHPSQRAFRHRQPGAAGRPACLAARRQRRRDAVAAGPDRSAAQTRTRPQFPGHQRHRDIGPPAGPAPARQHAASIPAAGPARLGRAFPGSLAAGFRALGRERVLAQSAGCGAQTWRAAGPGQWPALRQITRPLALGALAHPPGGRGFSRRARPGRGPGAAPGGAWRPRAAVVGQSQICRRTARCRCRPACRTGGRNGRAHGLACGQHPSGRGSDHRHSPSHVEGPLAEPADGDRAPPCRTGRGDRR